MSVKFCNGCGAPLTDKPGKTPYLADRMYCSVKCAGRMACNGCTYWPLRHCRACGCIISGTGANGWWGRYRWRVFCSPVCRTAFKTVQRELEREVRQSRDRRRTKQAINQTLSEVLSATRGVREAGYVATHGRSRRPVPEKAGAVQVPVVVELPQSPEWNAFEKCLRKVLSITPEQALAIRKKRFGRVRTKL